MKNVRTVANACVVVACGVVLGALTAGNVIVALVALSAQIVFAVMSFSLGLCIKKEADKPNVKIVPVFLPQVKPIQVKEGFTYEDLVSFGNYLLSPERTLTIEKEELKGLVGEWDLRNWLDKKAQSTKKDPTDTNHSSCGDCAQKDE